MVDLRIHVAMHDDILAGIEIARRGGGALGDIGVKVTKASVIGAADHRGTAFRRTARGFAPWRRRAPGGRLGAAGGLRPLRANQGEGRNEQQKAEPDVFAGAEMRKDHGDLPPCWSAWFLLLIAATSICEIPAGGSKL